MSKVKDKPKFVPPIKTAVSFVKSITESIYNQKFELSPILESSPKSNFERLPSLNIPNSPQFSKQSIGTSSKFVRNKKSKSSRDVSHLQDLIKYSKTEIDLTQSTQITILPTEIDKLKIYVQATSPSNRRIKSKHSQVCLKTSCIENITENSKPYQSVSIDDFSSIDFGAPSGQNEILNLKEWFKYMKSSVLDRVIENKMGTGFNVVDPQRFPEFELVVKAGIKEFMRQLHVLNMDRWELLSDLFQSLNLYWRAKFDFFEKEVFVESEKDRERIEKLTLDLQDKQISLKEKENQYNKDTGVLKLENLLKTEELQKLQETIKKLKADRIFRTKQELQRYNNLSKCLNDCQSKEVHQESDKKLQKTIKKKRESLTSEILNKIQMLRSESTRFTSRLSDEHLIEYEMLMTTSDEIFMDKGTQSDYQDFCRHQLTQTLTNKADAQCETDEILDVVVEEEKIKEVKKPKPSKHLSILVTNEHEENVLFFNASLNSISDIEGDSSKSNYGEEFSDKNSLQPKGHYQKRRRSVVGVYKTRLTSCSSTQTDNKVFIDELKKVEEELTEWILVERRKKLSELDKQIYSSKKQLGKVNSFISQHVNQVHKSVNYEDEGLDLDSDSSFDLLDNADLEHLKTQGIIGQNIDLDSWREGYKYRYEKGSVPKIEKQSDESLRTDSDQEESKTSQKVKVVRNNLGDDLFRTRRNTKIEEFKFQRKETKHHSYKPSSKPKFLENFLQTFKINSKKVTTMSKKNILKTINLLYSSALSKNSLFELNSLHLFVYEEFLGKYITKSAVDKKIVEFMTALVSYKDEKKIMVFNRLFGISVKNEVQGYARPKLAFNFFVAFCRLLESSHHGIDVGEINGKVYIPAIRAFECTKEVHGKFFESFKLQSILSAIERSLVVDPNKINKNLIEKDVLVEILMEHFDEYNKDIENFLKTLFQPFHFWNSPQKLHKQDFFILLRFFDPEKYKKIFGSSPLESLEKLITHQKSKPLISSNKLIDLCIQQKILLPDDVREEYQKLMRALDSDPGINLEIKSFQSQLRLVSENKEKFQLDNSFIINWEYKVSVLLQTDKKLDVTEKIMWKILVTDVRRMLSEC